MLDSSKEWVRRSRELMGSMGPGIVMAATGIGASDFFSSLWAGSSVGPSILWAVVFGVVLKYFLTEGIARRQIVTGESFVHLWMTRGPRAYRLMLAAYFAIWSICVVSMLLSATGLAASQFGPRIGADARFSIAGYGIGQGIFVLVLLAMNGYARFERFMRVLVAIAVTAIAYCLASVADRAFVPVMPAFRANDTVVVMAIVTGVGGTLTLLGYGAWIREKGYLREDSIPLMRIDCASAYVITGAVMSALILLASATLRVRGIVTDSEGAARAAFAELGALLTGFPLGRHVFALGFWAIVLSAMTGVFQSVPHLFAEGWFAFRGEALPDDVDRTPVYRIYQGVALACGCGLVFFRIPVLYLLYSAVSALFMPFLAANLLYFNSRSDMPARHRNRLGATVVLVLGFALFAYIGVAELGKALARLG